MIPVRAYLGGARFTKSAVVNHPQGWGVQAFTRVEGFGDSLPLFTQLAKKGVPLCVPVLMWKDLHDFSRSDSKFINKEAARFRPLIESTPNIDWYVSVVCEHKLRESDWLYLAHGVRDVLSGLDIELVNTPMVGKGFVSSQYINEYHGDEKAPRKGERYAFNWDGTSPFDSDFEKYRANYKDAVYFAQWCPQDNGNRKIFEPPDRPKPRKNRIHWTIPKQTQALELTFDYPKGATQFPKDCIGKSNSDQGERYPPSGKDCKPCFLTYLRSGLKPDRISLKTRDGTVIAQSSLRQTWDDEKNHKQIGYRWYFSEWGFEIARKAIRLQGNGVCDIFANRKKIGTWNPAFRDGVFRG